MRSDEPAGWVRADAGGVVLRVHVRPRASRPGVGGFHGAALAVRLSAAPVEGAANRELVRILARALGVAPRAVSIEAGAHGREKRVRVAGVAPDAVRERLGDALYVDTAGGHD